MSPEQAVLWANFFSIIALGCIATAIGAIVYSVWKAYRFNRESNRRMAAYAKKTLK